MDENKDVRRVEKSSRVELDASLKTKMIGIVNDNNPSIGFKKSDGTTEYVTADGGDAEYNSVTISGLAGGATVIGVDADGLIVPADAQGSYSAGDTNALNVADGDGGWTATSISVETVPGVGGGASIATDSGNYLTIGANGAGATISLIAPEGEISAQTTSGDVSLITDSGEVKITTNIGDIELITNAGDIDLNSTSGEITANQPINQATAGTEAYHTVRKDQVYTKTETDLAYVKKSGDTMTGNLIVPNATLSGHAINKGQADGGYLSLTKDDSIARNFVNKTNTADDLTFIGFYDAGDGVLFGGTGYGGNLGRIYKSTDNAESWRAIVTTGYSAIDDFYTEGNIVIAVGRSNTITVPTILRSTDNGDTFSPVALPTTTFSNLTTISATISGNTTTLWVVGGQTSSTDVSVLKSTNMGVSWTVETLFSTDTTTEVAYISIAEGRMIVTTGSGTGDADVYYSDNYNSFAKVEMGATLERVYRAVYCGNRRVLVGGGDGAGDGDIYLSENLGESFAKVAELSGISIRMLSYSNGVAVACGDTSGADAVVYRSFDLKTWETMYTFDATTERADACLILNDGSVLVGTGTGVNDGDIWVSRPIGYSWKNTAVTDADNNFSVAQRCQATAAQIYALGAKALINGEYLAMTTAGDMMYATTGGQPVRLPKGTAGQIIQMNSGATAPEWTSTPAFGTTGKTTFESTGHQVMTNDATVWEDANFDPTMLTGGGNLPSQILFASTSLVIAGFSGSRTDIVYATIEIPHCAKLNAPGETTVKCSFHAHIYPTNTAGGNTRWGLEYLFTKEGVAVTTSTTIYKTVTLGTTAWAKQTFEFDDITVPEELGSQFHWRFFRLGGDALDTSTADVAVGTVGLHYEIDSIGSRQILVK
jgi:hypothetical protein